MLSPVLFPPPFSIILQSPRSESRSSPIQGSFDRCPCSIQEAVYREWREEHGSHPFGKASSSEPCRTECGSKDKLHRHNPLRISSQHSVFLKSNPWTAGH